jgi:ferredoxin
VVALFAGRTFCSAVCPHGALQDLVLIRPVKVPGWLDQGLSIVPYVFLGAGLAFAATGSAFVICRYDPVVPLFRLTGSSTLMAIAGGILALSLFVGRPYCRFLCPYGALLRVAALASKWRVRITPDSCTQCRLCEESCPYGAIREPVLMPTTPKALAPARRRLGWLVVALPLALAAGGWLGSQLSVPLSRLHPTVALAEKYADPKRPAVVPNPPTPDSLALGRAERDAREVIARAVEVRDKFKVSGWLFGGWTALVVMVKLFGLSVRPDRTEFEPDRGACVACARCFLSCPNERVRLGLMPASELPVGPADVRRGGPAAVAARST